MTMDCTPANRWNKYRVWFFRFLNIEDRSSNEANNRTFDEWPSPTDLQLVLARLSVDAIERLEEKLVEHVATGFLVVRREEFLDGLPDVLVEGDDDLLCPLPHLARRVTDRLRTEPHHVLHGQAAVKQPHMYGTHRSWLQESNYGKDWRLVHTANFICRRRVCRQRQIKTGVVFTRQTCDLNKYSGVELSCVGGEFRVQRQYSPPVVDQEAYGADRSQLNFC